MWVLNLFIVIVVILMAAKTEKCYTTGDLNGPVSNLPAASSENQECFEVPILEITLNW